MADPKRTIKTGSPAWRKAVLRGRQNLRGDGTSGRTLSQIARVARREAKTPRPSL